MAIKKGNDAIDDLQQQGGDKEFTSFKSGTTLKVRVKGLTNRGMTDIATTYVYGIFKKINSFVPQDDPVRNSRGFVEDKHGPWDLASKYYYDKAFEADDNGESEDAVKALKDQGNAYRGRKRVLMGLYDVTKGEDIVIDVSPNQYETIKNGLLEYIDEDEYKDYAFKISKKGKGQSTTVTVSPVINPAKGLTDEERANFESSLDEAFDDSIFDGVLYEATYDEQLESLQQSGFDLGLIGLSAPKKEETGDDEVKPVADEDGDGDVVDIQDEDLPF